jgi:hypothetical protein
MQLADYAPQREQVSFRSGSLTVRGLALDDVAILMRENLSDLDSLLKMYAQDVDERAAVAATAQYAVALIRETPALVARMIALACDEPSSEHNARKLPIPVQVDLIKKIVELTFSEAGGAKKFFESLTGLLTVIRPTDKQQVSKT